MYLRGLVKTLKLWVLELFSVTLYRISAMNNTKKVWIIAPTTLKCRVLNYTFRPTPNFNSLHPRSEPYKVVKLELAKMYLFIIHDFRNVAFKVVLIAP